MHRKVWKQYNSAQFFWGLEILNESLLLCWDTFVEFLRISFLFLEEWNLNERFSKSTLRIHFLEWNPRHCCSKFIQKPLLYQSLPGKWREWTSKSSSKPPFDVIPAVFSRGVSNAESVSSSFFPSSWGPCDTKHWLSTVRVCATCCQRWADKSQTKKGRYMSQHSMLAVRDTVTRTLRKVCLALKSTLAKMELPRFILSFCDFASQMIGFWQWGLFPLTTGLCGQSFDATRWIHLVVLW